MKNRLAILIIYLALLFGCMFSMIYIWENSLLPALNKYEQDKGVNCGNS